MRINTISVADDISATPIADGEAPNEILETGNESDLDSHMQAVETHELDRQEHEEDLVALEAYYELGTRLVKSGKCTMESLQMLRVGAAPYMKNATFEGMALESEVTDITKEHEIVLEAMKETIKSLLHSIGSVGVVIFDDIRMLSKTFHSTIRATQEQVKSARESFKKKLANKGDAKELHIDIHILNNFFNFHKNSEKVFSRVLARDEAFSTYVLTKYSQSVEKELDALTANLRGERDFQKLVTKVASMSSPVALFDKKYLMPVTAGDTYLFGVWVEADSTAMEAFRTAFKKHDAGAAAANKDLKQLARALYIKERVHTANAHAMSSRVINPIGFMVGGAIAPVMKLTVKQIEDVLDAADTYLKNAQTYLDVLSAIEAKWLRFTQAYEGYSLDGQSFAKSDVNHIHKYAENLVRALTEPGKQELYRSLHGARYCVMMANRAVFVNA